MSKNRFFNPGEAELIIRRFRPILILTVFYLALGTTVYHFVEDMRWIDALYFSTVSLLTVGYGDFVPTSDAGKLFTIFYLLCGVGILAGFVSNIFRSAVARHEIKRSEGQK